MVFNSQEPLWLPKGSVRAILALILVISFVVYAPEKVGEVAAAVVAFYFASKIASDQNPSA